MTKKGRKIWKLAG